MEKKKETTPFSLARFEELAYQAFSSIPDSFHPYLENIMLIVQERPSRALLKKMGVRSGETLYGLYEGVPIPERGGGNDPLFPDRITIFRGPIVENFGNDEESIVREIRNTILHEVGHRFGLDDRDMEEYEI